MLACLLWSSLAWKMAARDQWIGWNAEQRVRNLELIVNNSRQNEHRAICGTRKPDASRVDEWRSEEPCCKGDSQLGRWI